MDVLMLRMPRCRPPRQSSPGQHSFRFGAAGGLTWNACAEPGQRTAVGGQTTRIVTIRQLFVPQQVTEREMGLGGGAYVWQGAWPFVHDGEQCKGVLSFRIGFWQLQSTVKVLREQHNLPTTDDETQGNWTERDHGDVQGHAQGRGGALCAR